MRPEVGGVRESDRLAAGDRLLQPGELPAGRAGVLVGGKGHRQLLQLVTQGIGLPPGDGREGQAQRTGIGEATVEGGQRQRQRMALGRSELETGKSVVLLGQAVHLGVRALGPAQRADFDADLLQIGPVAVEAAGEGVVAHAVVAFHRLPDLAGREGPGPAEKEGEKGQLAYELVLVATHVTKTNPESARGSAAVRARFYNE